MGERPCRPSLTASASPHQPRRRKPRPESQPRNKPPKLPHRSGTVRRLLSLYSQISRGICNEPYNPPRYTDQRHEDSPPQIVSTHSPLRASLDLIVGTPIMRA